MEGGRGREEGEREEAGEGGRGRKGERGKEGKDYSYEAPKEKVTNKSSFFVSMLYFITSSLLV